MAANDLILLSKELDLIITNSIPDDLAVKAISKQIEKFSKEDMLDFSIFAKNKLKELGIVDLLPQRGGVDGEPEVKDECYGRAYYAQSRECGNCSEANSCRSLCEQAIMGSDYKSKPRERRVTSMSIETKKEDTNKNETTIRGVKYRHVKAVIKGIKKWGHKFSGTNVEMIDGLGKSHNVPEDAIAIAGKLAKVSGEPVSDKSTVRHYLALENEKLIVLEKPAKTKASKEKLVSRKAAHKPEGKKKSMKKS